MSRINTMGIKLSKSAPRFTLLAGLLLAVSASASWADGPRNTFALRYHLGHTQADRVEPYDEADGNTIHFSGSYLFDLTPWFSLGVGYLDGDNDRNEPLFAAGELKYQAYAVIAEGRFVLSERHHSSLYARLSGLKYDYRITDAIYNWDNFNFFDAGSVGSGYSNFSDKGTSIGAAVGWSARFGSGIGLEVGYEYLRLGSQIEIETANFGLSFSF